MADLYCSGWYMDMVTSAALFHLEIAAKMKQLKAMYILGQKLLGLDTDELDELQIRTYKSFLTLLHIFYVIRST